MNISRHAIRANVSRTDWNGKKETFVKDFQTAAGEEDVTRFQNIITALGYEVHEIIAYTNENGETHWV